MSTKRISQVAESRADSWDQNGLSIQQRGRGTICVIPLPKDGGTMDCYENAQFIFAAVKAYDELLALARLCRDAIDDDLENLPSRHSLGNLRARLSAAIAKAEPTTTN